MSDERRNYPSASGYERLLLCPGSWQLERQCPREEDASEESRSGDRIHAFMEGKPVELSDDDERVAEKFRREEADLLAQFAPGGRVLREERLWLTPQGDTFSGRLDFLAIAQEALLVIDYKSGWLGATVAPRNPQLRAQAVLAAERYNKLTPDRPVIVAALLRKGAPTVAQYSREDLAQARRELEKAIGDATLPVAPRVPGEKQCRYCRARGVCPEASAQVSTLAVLDTREITQLDLVRLLDVCGAAEKVIGSIRATAKRRLEADPVSVPGWGLKPGVEREKVTDVSAVHGRFLVAGGQTEAFAAACSITKTNLKAALKEATGLKGKALDDLLKECTRGAVEVTQAAPSLERVA